MMNDLKTIKRLLLSCALILGTLATAQAVIIEGFSDSGQFLSVKVSDEGRLLISASTGVAQAVFFTSSQPVNAFQATVPWIVSPEGGSEWTVLQKGSDIWDINCITGCGGGGGDVITTPSTTTVQAFGQTALGGNVCIQISAEDENLAQRLFCNISTANTWVALAGSCNDSNGMLVAPGACYTPDQPITYSGAVHFFSTAPANIAFQEIRKP